MPSGNELNCVALMASALRLVRLSKMPSGNEGSVPAKPSPFKRVRLSNMLSGNELNASPILSPSKFVRPSKSPDFSVVILLSNISSSVIAVRCAAVTLAAEVTPGTAATIASRTCGVRLATGVIVPNPGNDGCLMVGGRKSVSSLVSWSK